MSQYTSFTFLLAYDNDLRMSITKQDLMEAIQIIREDFNNKFQQNDQRFEKMEQRFEKMEQQNVQQFGEMKQRISDGIESVRVLVEEQKSDFRMAYEVLQHHKTRLDNHEKRIDGLEKRP